MSIFEDFRLTLTPQEIGALSMMDLEQATLLLVYATQQGFFGMDFDHVPPNLEKAFSVYRNILSKIPNIPDTDNN